MKYLLACSAPVTTTIEADNLRGEPRWERNVLGACIGSGRPVHLTGDWWQSLSPLPPNLHNGYMKEWASESVFIVHGCPELARIRYFGQTGIAKYYIVYYFNTPLPGTEFEVLDLHKKNPGCIVATAGIKSWHYLNNLRKSYGTELVEYLPLPTVSCIHEDSHFHKPYLFWACKNFSTYAQYPRQMTLLFELLRSFMQADLSLRILFLTPDSSDKFWGLPFSKILLAYQDRIILSQGLCHKDLLTYMAQTRLVISPMDGYSATSIEAAAHGIPIVMPQGAHVWSNQNNVPLFSGLLTAATGISILL